MALTTFDAALASLLVDAADLRLGSQRLALTSAAGRVLAQDEFASIDVPGFANAAMDGYAVAVGSAGVVAGQAFRCVDLALAGAEPMASRLPPLLHGKSEFSAEECRSGGSRDAPALDTAIEIATGAILPEGADTVIQYELTKRAGDVVTTTSAIARGTHVRGATDDYRRDTHALTSGRVLDAGALAVLAAFGRVDVEVRSRPRIAIIVTGSELRPAGMPLARGQIHDSNSIALQTLIAPHAAGLTMLGPVVDDIETLRDVLMTAAANHDVVITAGGASAGRADFIPALVRELGQVHLHKIATRPGMPFLHGRIGAARVYGLPGNPVSVFASALTLVIPALRAMQGMHATALMFASLTDGVGKSHGRLEWRRGSLRSQRDGRLCITPHPMTGSGMLRGVAESNALFRMEMDTRRLGAGSVVTVLPFPA